VKSSVTEVDLINRAGRCLDKDSHKTNNIKKTETMDTIDPTLATIFQEVYISG
jgi:hypothetical protein